MWSEPPRTPRYVWSASAIAATLIHAIGIGWVSAHWRAARQSPPPSPIEVIPVPLANAPTGAPDPAALPPLPNATPTTSPSDLAPDPAIASPATPPTAPAAQGTDAPMPTAGSPGTPGSGKPSAAGGAPATASPPSPTPPSSSPPTPSPTGSPDGSPEPAFLASFTIMRLPNSGEEPETLPAVPRDWATQAFAAGESGCALPAGAAGSFQVQLRLSLASDGQVMAIAPWGDSDTSPYANLATCLVRKQLPPFIPAQSGGVPVATDRALLVVEGQIIGN